MTEEKRKQLENMLEALSREELEKLAVQAIVERESYKTDFKLMGETVIKILKTLNLLDDNLEFVGSANTVMKAIANFSTKAMFNSKQIEKQFSFLNEALPLINKHKNLLK